MQRFSNQHLPEVSQRRESRQSRSAYWRPHAFARSSIYAHAPDGPGVYGISNAREWIYIGASENIQVALLEYLDGGSPAIAERTPTGFSFELCSAGMLTYRHAELLRQYKPACNESAMLEAAE